MEGGGAAASERAGGPRSGVTVGKALGPKSPGPAVRGETTGDCCSVSHQHHQDPSIPHPQAQGPKPSAGPPPTADAKGPFSAIVQTNCQHCPQTCSPHCFPSSETGKTTLQWRANPWSGPCTPISSLQQSLRDLPSLPPGASPWVSRPPAARHTAPTMTLRTRTLSLQLKKEQLPTAHFTEQ